MDPAGDTLSELPAILRQGDTQVRLIDEMYTALEKLGSTAEEVRESLVNKGISMKCCNPGEFSHHTRNCPLHAYLLQEFGEEGVSVGPSMFSHGPHFCDLPLGAEEFVLLFDEHTLEE